MSTQPFTTVVRNGTIWTGGAAPATIYDTDLVIEDGVVVTIEPRFRGRADVEIDAGHCLVAPGLINAHTHPGSTPRARGVAEDLDLGEGAAFYHSLIPLLRIGVNEVSKDDVQSIIEWDTIAMLLGGATTIVAEMIVKEESGSRAAWMELVERLGFRGQFGLTYPNRLSAIGFIKDGKVVLGDPGDVGAVLETGLGLYDRYNGSIGDRLRVHLSPHGPDTVPEEVLRETKRHCQERGMHAHLHLAQHESELETIRQRHDKTPIEYLHDIGFLGPDVMATHVTFVNDSDIGLLAKTGTNVVHASYRKAKEGIASPYWDFLKRGINVAIATDSFSHDLIQDLKIAALLGKIRNHRVGEPAAEHVLRSATYGAAKALGRSDLGHLQPGARGDVIVVDMATPFNAPVFDPIRSLVYYSTAGDIRHTLVDGRPVVSEGKVIGTDMDAVRGRAMDACHRLWQRAVDEKALPPSVSYRNQ